MTIKYETSMQDFDFWSGAKQWVDKLTGEELEQLNDCLDDCIFESPTALNDFIWFEAETWMSWLGLDEDEILRR